MKKLIILFISLFSCQSGSNDSFDLKIIENLKDKEAKVDILINGKQFYADESAFRANINAGEQFISVNMSDQFGGNLQIQLTKPNWLKNKNEAIRVSNSMIEGYENYGVFLIGKRTENSLEGYVLSRGAFKWLLLSKEKAVLHCKGFVVSPQNAAIPENEIPFKGNIYFKQPVINLDGINEEAIF